MTLFVYKSNRAKADQLVKNLYSEGQTFYSFQSNLSATRVRKICDEIEKFAKQDVIKVGNPAKVLFDTEEDLMVCLGI